MGRLTQKDEQSNWCLKGMYWEDFRPGKVITEEMYERLYGALWKLMEYEDTGLDPEEVEILNDSEVSACATMMAVLKDKQQKHSWIPVEERLPEHKKTVLVWTRLGGVEKAWYGYNSKKWHFVYGGEYVLNDTEKVLAWMPLPEPYREEIKKNIEAMFAETKQEGSSHG